jgi:hypothetical protein
MIGSRTPSVVDAVLSPDIAEEIALEDLTQPAICEFNRYPRRGFAMLCQVFQCEADPAGMAWLLLSVSDLMAAKVGKFLAEVGNDTIFLPILRPSKSSSISSTRCGTT